MDLVKYVFFLCTALGLAPERTAGQKVSVTLYYESLCPFCRRWIAYQLLPLWSSELKEYVTPSLIPYGNAHEKRVDGHYKFQCQHGEEECVLNTIEACIIKKLGDKTDQLLGVIGCIEDPGKEPGSWHDCVPNDTLLEEVKTCATTEEGEQLQHYYAQETDGLVPAHKYVPWVLIDNKHSALAEMNLKSAVCRRLKDTISTVPATCNDFIVQQQDAHAHDDKEEGQPSSGRTFRPAPAITTAVRAGLAQVLYQ
ncbi:unnamed protein product [Vitrella brassicaformis CCMP3155]|uniref:Gamma-interferon-inducible lysosomal thiol reductase n=2 Tax=Vitrella brassicaformis TaxID=1169539 RepID=A0A0G4G753_VITBC|nr:unnamed protein product [Vitrella brassicaformis CCMP3155]|mmetsp:Transcript_48287/g.120868  ORF Transcript_48287/g.120868 Transcript_48287/m.120868 type:complete len:253 (+) Transcript_48287:78-836(+)|eukprot:CEM24451.1 unnamed protein product [Vitrella brassicaformis CCMP3155]